VEYLLVTAAIASAAVAGSEALAETILCGVDYLGSKVDALVEGGPITRAARCRVEPKGGPLPHIPPLGDRPAPFDPEDEVTKRGSEWKCDENEECEAPCPDGGHQKLRRDPGLYGEPPHWDWTDCEGNTWKIYRDGTMKPAR
jgi:hypothetical protein